MTLPQRLSLAPERRLRLVDVAQGKASPDAVVHARSMLNVYTGRIHPAEIGMAEGRIAWVGEIGISGCPPTFVVDDGVVVPGLIEPHCHPDVVYTPSALARELAYRGTTTTCADTLHLSLSLDDDELLDVVRGMSRSSAKFLWNLRGCLDGVLPSERERLGRERLRRLAAELPDVVATGEMTAWPEFLAGANRLTGLVDDAIARGRRVDGHAAGASARTLGKLAAAGITADHEAITPDELVARARLGYWVMLRHSSLRPDGPVLAQAITSGRLPMSRVMLTTDGPVAADLAEGHLDTAIRTLISAGVPPIEAVRMATLNPATYLGLDAHLGGIAPGRAADLVVVDSLPSFHPRMVLCEGVRVTQSSTRVGFTDWSTLHPPSFQPADLNPDQLTDTCLAGPSFRFDGVITRLAPRTGGLPHDGSYIALVARDGSWLVGGVVHGVAVNALASTFSGSGDVVVLGRDPESVLDAYRRVVSIGGGIATPARTVPLGHLGSLYDGTVPELAAAMRAVTSDLRFPRHLPPIEYFMLFLTGAVLPDVRLTPVGAIMVKTREVLQLPTKLRVEPALEKGEPVTRPTPSVENRQPRLPGRPRHMTPSPEYRKRREEIVEVAVQVFRAKGYESGTLDDVATELGLRKASLYYYVRSKAELLYLVFDRAISSALRELERCATSGSTTDRVERLVRHQITTVATDPSLFAVFFDQRPHLDAGYEADIHAKEQRYLKLFMETVQVAIDDGVLDVRDTRHAAQLLLGMTNWTYKWIDPDNDDVDGITDDAVRLVLGSFQRDEG